MDQFQSFYSISYHEKISDFSVCILFALRFFCSFWAEHIRLSAPARLAVSFGHPSQPESDLFMEFSSGLQRALAPFVPIRGFPL